MNETMTFLLARYGDYPHSKGLQHFTPESARAMQHHFNSLRSRMRRCFGGVPVYVGHPDDPAFAGQPGHIDTRAHGWVQALETTAEGLSVTVKWGETGLRLLANAHFKFFSPRWAMRKTAAGLLEPVRLISIGLTNNPNIPGETIANCLPQCPEDTGVPEGLRERLNLPPEVGWAQAYDRLDDLLAHGEADLQTQAEHFRRMAEDAESRCRELQEQLHALPTAANSGGMAPSSAGLSRRRSPVQTPARLLQTVHCRMQETGESFANAWDNLKQSRPDLFEHSAV